MFAAIRVLLLPEFQKSPASHLLHPSDLRQFRGASEPARLAMSRAPAECPPARPIRRLPAGAELHRQTAGSGTAIWNPPLNPTSFSRIDYPLSLARNKNVTLPPPVRSAAASALANAP